MRVIETLRHADLVLAEDTRVALRLLNHLDIKVRVKRCDENVIKQRIAAVLDELRLGRHIVFVSDAGTPGVADPGMQLVTATRKAGYAVEVLPGQAPCSPRLWPADSSTGFYLVGFCRRKEGVAIALLEQYTAQRRADYHESRTGPPSHWRVSLRYFRSESCEARELTKLHEEVLRGPAAQISGR